MNRNEIKWLDGKNAVGMYILEICYNDGTYGYLKNEDHEQISHYCVILSEMPEVASFRAHSPELQIFNEAA